MPKHHAPQMVPQTHGRIFAIATSHAPPQAKTASSCLHERSCFCLWGDRATARDTENTPRAKRRGCFRCEHGLWLSRRAYRLLLISKLYKRLVYILPTYSLTESLSTTYLQISTIITYIITSFIIYNSVFY